MSCTCTDTREHAFPSYPRHRSLPVKDSSYLKMVAEEWRLFRDGIPLGPTPTVRRLILDSWKRSRDALGARDPIAGVLPLRGEELTRKLDENRELITGAGPVMEQYRALLQSSNSVFLLASSDGIILYRHGAPGIIARMEHLDVGVVEKEPTASACASWRSVRWKFSALSTITRRITTGAAFPRRCAVETAFSSACSRSFCRLRSFIHTPPACLSPPPTISMPGTKCAICWMISRRSLSFAEAASCFLTRRAA